MTNGKRTGKDSSTQLFPGRKLREYRKKKKISLVELGKKLGISHQSLSDIENEKSNPSIDTLIALLKTDINFYWLLFGTGEMIHSPVAPGGEVLGRLGKALGLTEKTKKLKNKDSLADILSITGNLEKELELVPGSINPADIIEPDFDIPYENVIRLCIRQGISIDWVYTGKGAMFRAEREKPSPIDLDQYIWVKETIEKVLQKEKVHLPIRNKAGIEVLLYEELIEDPSRRSAIKDKIVKYVKLQK